MPSVKMGERLNTDKISFKGDRNGQMGTSSHCRLKYYLSASGVNILTLSSEKYLSQRQRKADGHDMAKRQFQPHCKCHHVTVKKEKNIII